jgi:hypothetical protein
MNRLDIVNYTKHRHMFAAFANVVSDCLQVAMIKLQINAKNRYVKICCPALPNEYATGLLLAVNKPNSIGIKFVVTA